MCVRLSWLFVIFYVVFVISVFLFFVDGGLFYDYFSYFISLMDRFGIGLGFIFVVKESVFLLWILVVVLSEKWLL